MSKNEKSSANTKVAKKKNGRKYPKVSVNFGNSHIDPKSELGKQLAEEERKNRKHPIMEYNWMQDLEYAGRPRCSTAPLITANILHPINSSAANSITVEADPNDFVVLKNENGDQQAVHAHADIWKYTLDKYIYMYFQLRLEQSKREQRQSWERITFPAEISEKIIAHKGLATGNTEPAKEKNIRQLGVDESFLQITTNKGSTLIGSTFETPSIGKALYLDTYLKSLYLPSNAGDDKLFSLSHDGLPFQLETKSKEIYKIPPFELEDYFLHEKISCISLAIEIAAIIIEAKEIFPNDSLWEEVFEKFSYKVLPTVVSSDMLFTRNTVARNFYQQIILDLTIDSYLWKENITPSDSLHRNWAQLIGHAISHIHTIVPNSDGIIYTLQRRRKQSETTEKDCSKVETGESDDIYGKQQIPIKYSLNLPNSYNDELERLLKHLEKLLSVVISPINISEYIKNPSHGLAMFCNPKHKYVDYFLDSLRNRNKNYSSYNKASEKIKIFYDVRKAIHVAQKFVVAYNHKNSKKIQYQINIPQEFWDVCNELYEGDGGVVFLERTLLQDFMAEQRNFGVKIIKNRIINQQNRKIKKKTNFLAEENIQIFEYDGKSVIYVKILS